MPSKVTRLVLSNYRSYAQAEMVVQDEWLMVVLTGENGAGKTNILEAVSYFSPGRGMRHAALGDVCRVNSGLPWAVSADFLLGTEKEQIGTGLDPEAFRSEGMAHKRVVRIEGESESTTALAGRFAVSWLTPQMDRLFAEAPSSRRSFLDRMVLGLYPDHGRQVSAYERLMRERNKILQDHGVHADHSWVSVIERQMAEHATVIAVARLDFTGQLAGLIEATSTQDSAFPKALLALDGDLEGLLNEGITATDVEETYRCKLEASRGVDAGKGRTSFGPHKTDLIVTHAPKSMPATLCSTGEQKALLINLILANARLTKALTGKAPILLLDEVAAHLDEYRRASLFDALVELNGQCWLTGTDASMFEALKGRAAFFTVTPGKIRAVAEADKENNKNDTEKKGSAGS
ncbi:DNA replication/repair protein RecF [Temperatibacter marinus]|uniref:DNA replication/repair protein RecF n=1 Tax=Temperatibacter marinus TaxID=1456591 RepID=UPI0035C6EE8D